jgi:hypothetical protein
MRIATSSFAISPDSIGKEAKLAFDKGEELVLYRKGSHDEEAINALLSSPYLQKKAVVGSAVGTAGGVTAGYFVDALSHGHPAVGALAKVLLPLLGFVAGGIANVDINYDPKADRLIAKPMQQTSK